LLVLPLLYGRRPSAGTSPPRFAVEYQVAAIGGPGDGRWLFDGIHRTKLEAERAIAAWEATGDRIGPHKITQKRIREVEPVRAWAVLSVGAPGAPPGRHFLATYADQASARKALRNVLLAGPRPEWGQLSVSEVWAPGPLELPAA
jgi:hypothetical protein